jgi:hypothetical protein
MAAFVTSTYRVNAFSLSPVYRICGLYFDRFSIYQLLFLYYWKINKIVCLSLGQILRVWILLYCFSLFWSLF